VVIIVTGVAGSGKTTIGRQLAAELGWRFLDADDYHPAANVEKMSRGIALDDTDRLPWLESLRDLVQGCLDREEHVVLACSALKASYRKYLLIDDARVRLVYLKIDHAVVMERLRARQGHFMKAEMLESQFSALEEPEEISHFDISSPPSVIVGAIRGRLHV
jgi:gluconokinase